MKFGHNLSRNQVPEWAPSYINYKGLKKLIKTAVEAAKGGEDPDLAGKSPYRYCAIYSMLTMRRVLLFVGSQLGRCRWLL